MDNQYVPNLTFGPMICQAIKPHAVRADGTPVPLDVHRMVPPVDALAQAEALMWLEQAQAVPAAAAPRDKAAKAPARARPAAKPSGRARRA